MSCSYAIMELNKVNGLIPSEALKAFLKINALPGQVEGHAVISAIDIGYGYTKYTTSISDDGKIECGLFPSIAPMSPHEELSGDFFIVRDTKKIESGGIKWEVGPDVYEIATRNDVRALHDNFVNSEQWKVLFLGALAYQGNTEIDYLILGLPVSNMSKREEMEKMAKGTHVIGDLTVVIHNVVVVPQPLGALYNFAVRSGDFSRFTMTNNLVIDPGYLTFDFLLTRGFSVNSHRSGARPGGMSSILGAIASSISQEMHVEYDDLNELDKALNLKNYDTAKDDRHVFLYGKKVELLPHIKNTVPVIDSSLNFMLNKIGESKDIAQLIMAGGPNKIFERSIKKQFPHHELITLDDGIFANVIGFMLWGMMVAYGKALSKKPAIEKKKEEAAV